MAEYLSISGKLSVNHSYSDLLRIETLERIARIGVPTEYHLKGSLAVEIIRNGSRGVALLYHPNSSTNHATALKAEGKDIGEAEAAMRSAMAFEIARYLAARETSQNAAGVSPIGEELSDLVKAL